LSSRPAPGEGQGPLAEPSSRALWSRDRSRWAFDRCSWCPNASYPAS